MPKMHYSCYTEVSSRFMFTNSDLQDFHSKYAPIKTEEEILECSWMTGLGYQCLYVVILLGTAG